jgi:hypothetical protein
VLTVKRAVAVRGPAADHGTGETAYGGPLQANQTPPA